MHKDHKEKETLDNLTPDLIVMTGAQGDVLSRELGDGNKNGPPPKIVTSSVTPNRD